MLNTFIIIKYYNEIKNSKKNFFKFYDTLKSIKSLINTQKCFLKIWKIMNLLKN